MTVKELVTNECANHSIVFNEIRDYCCLEATPGFRCIFMASENPHPRCRYFEESVLPLDPVLESLYFRERTKGVPPPTKEERERIKDAFKVQCAACGRLFSPSSRRQQYCERCRRRKEKGTHKTTKSA